MSISRRQLALAAAASLSARPLSSQDDRPPGLPPADEATVEAKYANVIRKYGDRLSDPQRARARQTIVRHQRMLMRVRDFALENGDAPATGLILETGRKQP